MRPVVDFETWFAALLRPSTGLEALALVACLLLAWVLVRGVRGASPKPQSVWFGERIVDGVLFPALALLSTLAARELLKGELPLALLTVAVPILSSLLIIRVAVRVFRVAFPRSRVVRAVERYVSWIVWIGLVAWLTGLLPLFMQELDAISWQMGDSAVSLRSLIEGILSAVAVLVLMLWLSAAIEDKLLAGTEGMNSAGEVSMRKIAANGTRALLLLVGLLFALSAAGIPLTALSVFGGAVGVGIGLGLQKLASNYVSGFVILAERSLRIGDMVRVDNFEGRITDISTRYTVIRALNGRESIVPNELLITQRVENLSLADPRVSLNTLVQVAYGTDVEALMPEIAQRVASVPRVIADPAPSVQLRQFASDGLELKILFWIQDAENGQGNVTSEVNLAILRLFAERGVEIPFPQRVLHQRPSPEPPV